MASEWYLKGENQPGEYLGGKEQQRGACWPGWESHSSTTWLETGLVRLQKAGGVICRFMRMTVRSLASALSCQLQTNCRPIQLQGC